LHEHDCDELGRQIITPLDSCPICLERLDVSPVFPSSVADYLRRTKATKKLNVTFDYETGVFVAVDDGEFVLIINSPEASIPLLPRSASFTSGRDFYELYQDYYHCNSLNAGEVHVIEPAFVEPVENGWKLRSMGLLDVEGKRQNNRAVSPIAFSDTKAPVPQKPPLTVATLKDRPTMARCTHCGSLVETKYIFCWHCGNAMTTDGDRLKQQAPKISASETFAIDDEEASVQHEVGQVQPSIFAWALPNPTGPSASTFMLLLFAFVVVALLLLPLGRFVLTRSTSRPQVSSDLQRVATNSQSASSTGPSAQMQVMSKAEPKKEATPTALSGEDELHKLRAKRISASSSDRTTILQAFATSEKRFPNDYRFPYERAKLAITGPQTTAHEDAFSALSLAAEKAIKTDKAEEMLEGLEADKGGDFHKLSHGHREWTQVLEALKSKDATLLAANTQY